MLRELKFGLKRKVLGFCHLWFGFGYACPEYVRKYHSPSGFGKGKACWVRKFRWFLRRPRLLQSSLVGTYKQVADRLPGAWTWDEIEYIYGFSGWKESDQIIEFDLLYYRFRNVVFKNTSEGYWYFPTGPWQRCAGGTVKPSLGGGFMYSFDYWWELG